jgi:hypothetical protein
MRIVLKVLNRGTGIAIRIVSSIGRIVSALLDTAMNDIDLLIYAYLEMYFTFIIMIRIVNI